MRLSSPQAIAALTAALLLVLWWSSKEDKQVPTAAKKIVSTPEVQTRSPDPKGGPPRPPPPPAPAKPIEAIETSKQLGDGRPAGSVKFRVIDDWVVGFGDILLGKPSREDYPEEGFTSAPKVELWPDGRIPYSIHVDLYDPERVLRVVEYFNTHTGLKLVPYESGPDSVVFAPFRDHCLSYLGRIGGHQPIFLDDRCRDGEIMHEVMHAAGFVHEHSRPDRDRYVKINWDNVEDLKKDQFEIVPESLAKNVKDRPFDLRSIMIYNENAFAKDRSSWTLKSVSGEKIDPPFEGLSREDIDRIRMTYGSAR
ncbi:MAG: M12 family metallopeptidase [Bdellovibrionales bacterium]